MPKISQNKYYIDRLKCTGCKACLEICPNKAINKYNSAVCAKCIKYCITINQKELKCTENTMCIIEEKCNGCGDCVSVCPVGAIKPIS